MNSCTDLGGKRRMHHQRVRRGGDPPDRGEILARVVADVGVQVRADRRACRCSQARWCSRRVRTSQRARADGAACAGAVVDDDLLAERFAELVADRADDDRGAAAGRERDDQRDRPVGKIRRGRRDGFDQQGRRRAGHECAPADVRHLELLRRFLAARSWWVFRPLPGYCRAFRVIDKCLFSRGSCGEWPGRTPS